MAGNNTVYCHCQTLNKRNNYGVCLFTVKAFEEAKLSHDSDCYGAINSGSCEARRLRQQERDAGRALFFKKREIPVTVVSDNKEIRVNRESDAYRRGWMRGGVTSKQPAGLSSPKAKPITQAPTPKPKKEEGFSIKGSLSEAVTAAVKMESSSKAAQSSQPTKPLSLLERARLAAASK